MAGSKTAYLSQVILDHMLGGTPFVPPTTLYLCLSTFAFSSVATGAELNEVVAPDYLRIAVDNDAVTWSSASAGAPSEKHNLVELTFAAAEASWGTPESAYLADAATDGNLLFGADITNPQPIDLGDTAKIAPGALIFNED